MKWQPIETAPKDGTEILGLIGKYPRQKVRPMIWQSSMFPDRRGLFHIREWVLSFNLGDGDFEYCHILTPTHWMTLPDPPEK